MANRDYTTDEIVARRAHGMSLADIIAETGLNRRTVMRKLARAAVRLTIPPLADPVPEGFVVTKLATELDKNGKKKGQHVQSKPEGYVPEDEELVPAGHIVKGLSTYVNSQGAVVGQWIKTKRDDELAEMARQAVLAALIEKIDPIQVLPLPVEHLSEDLLTQYVITDYHIGMLAWSTETLDGPWDLEIAERTLIATFGQMIASAPPSKYCVLAELGDFLHFDSLDAVTPTSKHLLDADSRYQKVVSVAARVLEKVILMAATKHEIVYVEIKEGNHDIAGSVWLRVMFGRLFCDNPRIKVNTTPNPYSAIRHGKTMLGYYHGHLAKKTSLPQIFAAQFRDMWGVSEFCYIHTGHLHNEEQKEYAGCKVLQHPTLAAPDAYAARYGYSSKRQAMSITYSARYGEVGRATFLPMTVKEAA